MKILNATIIIFIERCNHFEIADPGYGGCIKVNVLLNYANTPKILAFKKRTIAPAIHFNCQNVISWFKVGGNPEFGW